MVEKENQTMRIQAEGMHGCSSTDILLGYRDWVKSLLRRQHHSQGCFTKREWGRDPWTESSGVLKSDPCSIIPSKKKKNVQTANKHEKVLCIFLHDLFICYRPWARPCNIQALGSSIKQGGWSLRYYLTSRV